MTASGGTTGVQGGVFALGGHLQGAALIRLSNFFKAMLTIIIRLHDQPNG